MDPSDSFAVDTTIATPASHFDLSETSLSQHALNEALEGLRCQSTCKYGVQTLSPIEFFRTILRCCYFIICISSGVLNSRLIAGSNKSDNLWSANVPNAFRCRRKRPYPSTRVLEHSKFLEIGASPGKTVAEFRSIAFLRIVQLRNDVLWKSFQFYDFVVNLFDRAGATESVHRSHQRIEKLVVCGNFGHIASGDYSSQLPA